MTSTATPHTVTFAATISRVGDSAGFSTDVTIDEGATTVFTVQMSKTSLIENTFDLGLVNGTAVLDLDYAIEETVNGVTTNTIAFSNGVTYNSTTKEVTVPAGVSSFTVAIKTVDDLVDESGSTPETFTINVGGQEGTGTINDNDGSPTIAHVGDSSGSTNNVTVLEGISTVFTVNLSHTGSAATSFALLLTDDSASVTSDYAENLVFSDGVTFASGNISVPAGVASFTVTVPTADGAIYELTETFNLSLGAVNGVGGVEGTGTITDNDTVPTISYVGDANGNNNNVTIVEATDAVFTVIMSNASSIDSTFTLALLEGSANLTEDYKANLTFSERPLHKETKTHYEIMSG